MQQFRQTLLGLINDNRTNPTATAQKLKAELSGKFHEDQLNYYHKSIETFEGVDALEDYVKFMGKVAPVGYLTMSDALNKAAAAIATEKGSAGRADHEAPRVIYERISVNAKVEGRIAELISLKAHSAEEIATYFLLDDGFPTRKRRRMLLDSNYKYIGIGTAFHRSLEVITVILLADSLTESSSSQPIAIQGTAGFEGSVVNRPTNNDY